MLDEVIYAMIDNAEDGRLYYFNARIVFEKKVRSRWEEVGYWDDDTYMLYVSGECAGRIAHSKEELLRYKESVKAQARDAIKCFETKRRHIFWDWKDRVRVKKIDYFIEDIANHWTYSKAADTLTGEDFMTYLDLIKKN